jgi:hypothetical protein
MSFAERRSSPRRSIKRQAKIVFGGLPPRDCLIMNISEGGVRVFVGALEVPDRFVLLLADGKGQPQPRDCQVAWRHDFELGGEFLDTAIDRGSPSARSTFEPA